IEWMHVRTARETNLATPTPWNEILDSHDDPPLTWPLPPCTNAEVDLLIQKVALRFSASSLCHIFGLARNPPALDRAKSDRAGPLKRRQPIFRVFSGGMGVHVSAAASKETAQ